MNHMLTQKLSFHYIPFIIIVYVFVSGNREYVYERYPKHIHVHVIRLNLHTTLLLFTQGTVFVLLFLT